MEQNFEGLEGDELNAAILRNIDQYKTLNLFGIILSATLV